LSSEREGAFSKVFISGIHREKARRDTPSSTRLDIARVSGIGDASAIHGVRSSPSFVG